MAASEEVSAADIARIAGVGRAAVSNWRRRHPDFPAPVGGTPGSPRFAVAEVEAWLAANGRVAAVNTAPSGDRDGHRDMAVAEAMAALLPGPGRGTLLDPACGDGVALVAAARRFGPRMRYLGYDTDPHRVESARSALTVAGFDADIRRYPTGADQMPVGTVEAVVCVAPNADPPVDGAAWEFGMPARGDAALGWVQVCLARLAPGGVAVLAVPFAVAVRASGRRVRAELLRAGVLTHVVALPEGAGPGGAPRQLWVLGRPAKPTYLLRMVDLTDHDPDDLPGDDRAWGAVFADPARTRDVPAIELLDEDVFLAPAAHLAAPVTDVRDEYAALRARYATGVRDLPDAAPAFPDGPAPAGGTPPAGDLVTVNDLVRSGAVAFVDRAAARPGDVLVPGGAGGFDARVIGADGVDDGGPAAVLRCDPDTLDPHFLACFLRSRTNRRQAAGTLGGTFRLDVRRARIPRMPVSEQRRYGEAFRRLTAFTDAAAEVAAAADAATRTAIDGLTGGSLAPE